jgi:hypothetical protein
LPAGVAGLSAQYPIDFARYSSDLKRWKILTLA